MRDDAIKSVMDTQGNVFGMMDTAFDFNCKTVQESIQEMIDMQTAIAEYLQSLYGLQRNNIEWAEVLDYAENNGVKNASE